MKHVIIKRAALATLTLLLASGCGDLSGADGADGVAGDASAADALAQHSEQRSADREAAVSVYARGLEGARSSGGIGELQAGQGDAAERLELASLLVDARLSGDVVQMRVEHVFHNPSAKQLEGTFRFPLPQGAMLTGLAMQIGDHLVDGELVERNKARKTYQSIVDSMRDPALLEWEEGNRFKLRVFPIEARSDKRVVLRYLAPLDHSTGRSRLIYSGAAPGMQGTIGRFKLAFGGRTVVDQRDWTPKEDVIVPVPRAQAVVWHETRPDGLYTAIRIQPDWRAIAARPANHRRRQRRVAILLDTSRSALEQQQLALHTLRAVFEALAPEHRFMLLSSDLRCRRLTPHWASGPAAIEAAFAAVAAIEPDGASDLGAALGCAAEAFAEGHGDGADQLVYIGDGIATWGQTDPNLLVRARGAALEGVEPHAALLGKGAHDGLFGPLARRLGGRVAHLRKAGDASAFANFLRQTNGAIKLRQATVRFEGGNMRASRDLGTLFQGESRTLLIRTALDRAPPEAVTLVGLNGWSGYVQRIPLNPGVSAEHVALRYARERIQQMERDGRDRDDIVSASLGWGVMSRHTSFLVLESEEAYRKHGIERRRKEQGDKPRVTGGDLESLGGGPSLRPDRIQPGDPEIRIPAPADALSVTVILPWGQTLDARYECEGVDQGAWVARFLIDRETPDGVYQVLVRVAHRDGAVELLRLPFTVDTKAPAVRVRIRRHRRLPGTWQIRAWQRITSHEMDLISPDWRRSPDRKKTWKRRAHVASDAKGVEVRFPDGQIVPLTAIRRGFFRGDWTPQAPVQWPLKVQVFAIDTALNQAAMQVDLKRPRSK